MRNYQARQGARLFWLAAALLTILAAVSLQAADDKKKEREDRPAARPAPQGDRSVRPQRDQAPRSQPDRSAQPSPAARHDNPPATRSDTPRPSRDVRPQTPSRDGGYSPADRGGSRSNYPSRDVAPSQVPNPPPDARRSGGGRDVTPSRMPNSYPDARRSGGARDSSPQYRTPDRAGSPNSGVSRGSDGRVQSYRSPAGHEVRYGPGGSVSTIRAKGRTIYRGPSGGGRIIHERPDRVVIVTNRSGHGYVQRPFTYGGHEYVNRTYYRQGVAYSRYYRPYTYRGVVFYGYAPVRYYSPAFYGWAYRPWSAPVYYRWGWAGSPWYGYYGGYFSPAPYYASPTLWLVDYIIAERLAESYNEQIAASQARPYYQEGTPLTPEVKQAIAMEVQRQLALENQQSQMAGRNDGGDPGGDLPQLLSDNQPHVFVVSYTLDVTDDRGQTCSVTRGDVLRLSTPPPPDAAAAYVQVIASKGQDCRVGSTITVSLQDLQDTNNQMRESVSAGMGELQTRSGQNGLPALPAAARAQGTPAPFASAAPPADAQVAQELTQEVQEADRVEQQVINEARSAESTPGGSAIPQPQTMPAPTRITKGQTVNDVVAVLGNPSQIVDLGKKVIYIYPSLKITFTSGRVSDVE